MVLKDQLLYIQAYNARRGSHIIPVALKMLPQSGSVSFASNGAHRILRRTVNTGVRDNLVLVVANCRLGDRADVIRSSLQHVWMVWRKDRCSSANDGTKSIVELLGLRLQDSGLQRGAGGSLGVVEAGDVWMLVEVVVVVGGCAYDGALSLLACCSEEAGGAGSRTV